MKMANTNALPPAVRRRGQEIERAGVPPAIACTLELSEMESRLARLRRLTQSSLISHHLRDNVLCLAYRPEAEAEVNRVVELERDCCRFLDFVLRQRQDHVHLTITAPHGVGTAVKWLFAQFLPEPDATALARPCYQTCAAPVP